MKKNLLRFMLLVTGLLLGVNVTWADPSTGTVDFEAKSRSTYTDGIWTTAGNTGNGYALALADLSGLDKIATAATITLEFDAEILSGGRIWIGIGDKSIRSDNANGSNKNSYNTDGLFLVYGTGNGSTVTANGAGVANALVLSHFVFTLDRTNSTYSYTVTDKATSDVLKTESNIATTVSNATVVEAYSWLGNMSCTLGAVSYSYEVATATTSYTVKFVDSNNQDLKDPVEHDNQVIGGSASASAAEMAAFDANSKHYVFDAEATVSTSIASLSATASENVITLVFKEVSPVESLKVNYMLGETVIDSQDGAIDGLYVGESTTVPYRMYVVKDGKLYKANTSGGTAYYGKVTDLTENTVVEVPVTEVDLQGGQIMLFTDLDGAATDNANVRASYCSAYNNTAYTSEEELPAGTYTFIVRALNKGRGSSIAVGETTVCAIEDIVAKNSWGDKTFENVEIPTAGHVTLVKGEQNTIDYYDIIIAIKKQQASMMTFTGTVGEQVSLTFGVYDTEDEYSVDFGDGNLQTAKVGVNNAGPVDPETGQTTAATVFTGTVAGDGTIKVYGNNDVWYLVSSGAMPTTLDQEKLMNVVQMSISGVNAESVALPAYEKLTQFSFTNSPVKSVDISSVPTLTRIDFYNTTESAFEPQLETIDVSQNVNLETIVVGGNFYKKGMITALDLTNNTMLTQLSAENNKIASITGMPVSLKNIYLSNNELETLTFPEFTTKGTIQIQNNKFTLATLPTKPTVTSNSKYTYAPQPAYEVAETVTELDLSSQLTATGILTESVETTYSFVTGGETPATLVEGTDYEVTAPGKFKFLTAQTEKVHGVMATEAFPKFTGANAYVTTEFTVAPAEPAQTLVLTLNGTVGEQASLTFGVYDTEDEYAVDFGDGNLQTAKVGVNNAGPVDPETGQTTAATVFTGTVAGDGTIKVYGNNDIWYLVSSGAMPTALDQEKLMNVQQMTISGVDVESVALPAYEKLTQFSFTNSPVKSVDIASVPTLTRIDFYNTTESTFEPQLETIDVSKNVNLETIVVGGNFYKKGMITALDLTNNTMLTQLSAENNKIASVTGLPASLKNIYLSNNELETLTFPEFTTKGTIQVQNNKFTLATLPAKPAITSNSKYTYAPQPAYEVAESVTELDLSSQLTATGILTEPATTTYSFKTVSGTALAEGTDYEVTEPGKFKFIKEQTENVYGVMATAAFPKFTGANEYRTTEFTVVPGEPSAISNVNAAKMENGKYYNLQGVEIQKPVKGVYIQNGHKVVMK